MRCPFAVGQRFKGRNVGHKADKTFFEKKRHWSKRKDKILGYYLTPYLAKVSKLG